MTAVLPAGSSAVDTTELASAMDDYVHTRVFATAAGLVTTWCNTDDTGFLADKGASGVRCRVLTRVGPRDFEPFDGYPDGFDNLGHDFGFVAGHVASVHRVRPSGEHVYRATADAPPSVVAVTASEVSFVGTNGSAPALFVVNGESAIVAFGR